MSRITATVLRLVTNEARWRIVARYTRSRSMEKHLALAKMSRIAGQTARPAGMKNEGAKKDPLHDPPDVSLHLIFAFSQEAYRYS